MGNINEKKIILKCILVKYTKKIYKIFRTILLLTEKYHRSII